MRNSLRPSAWGMHLIAILLACAAMEAFHRVGLDWFRWTATTAYNPSLQEGLAWRLGRLDLRYRLVDTAVSPNDGRVYNVYPPLQSVIGFVAAAVQPDIGRVLSGGEMPVYHLMPLAVFGLPILAVSYWVFFERTRSRWWAAALTAGLVGGTALMPCIVASQHDDFHYVNHLLATTGLLLLAHESLSRRRTWIMVIALMVAAWSRQLTFLYSIAILVATYERQQPGTQPDGARPQPRGAWIGTTVGICIVLAGPMLLNWLRLHDPLDNGYQYIYEGRDDRSARNVSAHGLFSPYFVPLNARYMNVAFPISPGGDHGFEINIENDGASLWLTTPLAVLALLGIRVWWLDRTSRWLILPALPIILAHLLYHNTGSVQPGYYRFALDYLPVWFVVAAPWLTTGRRRWVTIACIAWSVAYFALICNSAGPRCGA